MEILKAWQKVIPDQGKEFKRKHVLCELHFKKEDVERERVVYKKGGIVEREVRKHPLLKEDAIPCYFSKNVKPRAKQRVDAKNEYAVKLELPANFAELLAEECAKLAEMECPKELERKSFYQDLTEHVKKNGVDVMLGDDKPHPFNLLQFSHLTADCAVWCWWNANHTCVLKRLLIFKSGKVQVHILRDRL